MGNRQITKAEATKLCMEDDRDHYPVCSLTREGIEELYNQVTYMVRPPFNTTRDLDSWIHKVEEYANDMEYERLPDDYKVQYTITPELALNEDRRTLTLGWHHFMFEIYEED